MKKNRKQRYRDGLCTILEEIVSKSNFGAQLNPTKFKKITMLPFDFKTIRIKDVELENILDTTFELKINTPNNQMIVDSNVYVYIEEPKGRFLYKVEYLDVTREEYYFYLSRLGEKEIYVE